MEKQALNNTTVLEIAELPDGDVVLRAAGGEVLVTIRFAEPARNYVGEGRLQVAKAMIEAGIQTAAHLAGADAELDFLGPRDSANRSLH
jgi:hypothetical protein